MSGIFSLYYPLTSWCPDVTLISGHLLLDSTWSTHTTLGSDHLPILTRLPGLSTAPRRARSYVNFLRADWEGFERETELLFSSLAPPPPLSCAKGEKEFRKVLATAAKHNIPAGYRRDFRGHRIPEAVRSLIEERDSCRTNDPNDAKVKILDDLVQRGIRQEAQDQWQSLLDRSGRRTTPTRYWALLRKLSGKGAPQPPNISISFGGSPLSGTKTIAGAFTKQFTAVAVPVGVRPTPAPEGGVLRPDRTWRRLLRHIHRDHPVDHDFWSSSQQCPSGPSPPPPKVDPSERLLPRTYRSALSQLRSGYCSRQQSYIHRVAPSPACPDFGSAPHTTSTFSSCPESPTDLAPADLWTAPPQAAQFISSIPAFANLPPQAPRPHTHTNWCWSSSWCQI